MWNYQRAISMKQLRFASGNTVERISNCPHIDFLNIRYLTNVRVTGILHHPTVSTGAIRVTQPALSSNRNDQLYSSFALLCVPATCAALLLVCNCMTLIRIWLDNKKIQLGIHMCFSYCTFLLILFLFGISFQLNRFN